MVLEEGVWSQRGHGARGGGMVPEGEHGVQYTLSPIIDI